GTVAQRLVRVLCPHCKREAATDVELWQTLAGNELPVPERVHEPGGCLSCRETGYKGRACIYEVMPFTETLHPFADAAAGLPGIGRQAGAEGMNSLRLSGAMKVAAGSASLLEVQRVAQASE